RHASTAPMPGRSGTLLRNCPLRAPSGKRATSRRRSPDGRSQRTRVESHVSFRLEKCGEEDDAACGMDFWRRHCRKVLRLRPEEDNRLNQRTINYFALGPLSVPLFAASFLLARKLHMVTLAFKSWLVFPTCFSTSYCSPPGQVLPCGAHKFDQQLATCRSPEVLLALRVSVRNASLRFQFSRSRL